MNIIFKSFKGKENHPYLVEAPNQSVPFREEDRDNIIHLCMTKSEWIAFNNGRTWQPDPEKIYSVEGNYKIETPNWIHPEDKFAVLLKEETVNKPEKVESQRALWREANKIWLNHGNSKALESQFHISRIKPE